MSNLTFLRRLGPKSSCAKTEACPDIILLEGGDYAVIGLDITSDSLGRLPPTVACGANERIVRIPRKTLILARPDIPEV